jgi:GNAT superfamily N-acetyltransferase
MRRLNGSKYAKSMAAKPGFIVRDVLPEDHDKWMTLWDGYNAFYGRVGPSALPFAVTESTWTRFFESAEPVHAVVAEEDGKLLGLAHYLFHRNTTLIENTCYLQDLFTIPQERGRGVGGALIEAVADRAGKAGAGRLYWHTHETNLAARRLYDRVADNSGFIVYRKSLTDQILPK